MPADTQLVSGTTEAKPSLPGAFSTSRPPNPAISRSRGRRATMDDLGSGLSDVWTARLKQRTLTNDASAGRGDGGSSGSSGRRKAPDTIISTAVEDDMVYQQDVAAEIGLVFEASTAVGTNRGVTIAKIIPGSQADRGRHGALSVGDTLVKINGIHVRGARWSVKMVNRCLNAQRHRSSETVGIASGPGLHTASSETRHHHRHRKKYEETDSPICLTFCGRSTRTFVQNLASSAGHGAATRRWTPGCSDSIWSAPANTRFRFVCVTVSHESNVDATRLIDGTAVPLFGGSGLLKDPVSSTKAAWVVETSDIIEFDVYNRGLKSYNKQRVLDRFLGIAQRRNVDAVLINMFVKGFHQNSDRLDTRAQDGGALRCRDGQLSRLGLVYETLCGGVRDATGDRGAMAFARGSGKNENAQQMLLLLQAQRAGQEDEQRQKEQGSRNGLVLAWGSGNNSQEVNSDNGSAAVAAILSTATAAAASAPNPAAAVVPSSGDQNAWAVQCQSALFLIELLICSRGFAKSTVRSHAILDLLETRQRKKKERRHRRAKGLNLDIRAALIPAFTDPRRSLRGHTGALVACDMLCRLSRDVIALEPRLQQRITFLVLPPLVDVLRNFRDLEPYARRCATTACECLAHGSNVKSLARMVEVGTFRALMDAAVGVDTELTPRTACGVVSALVAGTVHDPLKRHLRDTCQVIRWLRKNTDEFLVTAKPEFRRSLLQDTALGCGNLMEPPTEGVSTNLVASMRTPFGKLLDTLARIVEEAYAEKVRLHEAAKKKSRTHALKMRMLQGEASRKRALVKTSARGGNAVGGGSSNAGSYATYHEEHPDHPSNRAKRRVRNRGSERRVGSSKGLTTNVQAERARVARWKAVGALANLTQSRNVCRLLARRPTFLAAVAEVAQSHFARFGPFGSTLGQLQSVQILANMAYQPGSLLVWLQFREEHKLAMDYTGAENPASPSEPVGPPKDRTHPSYLCAGLQCAVCRDPWSNVHTSSTVAGVRSEYERAGEWRFVHPYWYCATCYANCDPIRGVPGRAPAWLYREEQARQKRQFTKAPTVHEHKPGQAFATTDSGGGRKKQRRRSALFGPLTHTTAAAGAAGATKQHAPETRQLRASPKIQKETTTTTMPPGTRVRIHIDRIDPSYRTLGRYNGERGEIVQAIVPSTERGSGAGVDHLRYVIVIAGSGDRLSVRDDHLFYVGQAHMPPQRWGAIFGPLSYIILARDGIPLPNQGWSISVWFRGGAWVRPLPSNRHFLTLCESSAGDKLVALDHQMRLGCFEAPSEENHDMAAWHATSCQLHRLSPLAMSALNCEDEDFLCGNNEVDEDYEDEADAEAGDALGAGGDSEWVHLVVTSTPSSQRSSGAVTPAQMLFYFNGVPVGQVSGFCPLDTDIQIVGNSADGHQNWGALSDFRAYSMPLSSDPNTWPDGLRLKPPVDAAALEALLPKSKKKKKLLGSGEKPGRSPALSAGRSSAVSGGSPLLSAAGGAGSGRGGRGGGSGGVGAAGGGSGGGGGDSKNVLNTLLPNTIGPRYIQAQMVQAGVLPCLALMLDKSESLPIQRAAMCATAHIATCPALRVKILQIKGFVGNILKLCYAEDRELVEWARVAVLALQ